MLVYIGHTYAELFWILVDNGHRRRGIAKKLIDLMILESWREWKVKSFRLHVLTQNKGGIKLYKN